MGGTDFVLMRFGCFTIEVKWKFLHFLSADFLLRFCFETIDYFAKKFIHLPRNIANIVDV